MINILYHIYLPFVKSFLSNFVENKYEQMFDFYRSTWYNSNTSSGEKRI